MKYKKLKPMPIGIIGGMGPQASNELYRLLIERAERDYGARNNDEYPEVLIDSVPVPDFLADTRKMEQAARILEDRVRRLTDYGVSAITMACNTACILYDRLQTQTKTPIISVVKEVGNAVARKSKHVLILASPTSLRLRLYQKVLKQKGVTFITPKTVEYLELEYIIRSVLAGGNRKRLMRRLVRFTERYVEKGNVDGIVLGCTELPLVFPQNYHLPVYSSLDILAKTLLKQYYYGKEQL